MTVEPLERYTARKNGMEATPKNRGAKAPGPLQTAASVVLAIPRSRYQNDFYHKQNVCAPAIFRGRAKSPQS